MMIRGHWIYVVYTFLFIAVPSIAGAGNGITPEQIFQATIEWQDIIGTWEVLPEENPLAERDRAVARPSSRVLITLRKDGTCRMFGPDHPAGSDGLWTFEDHEMYLKMQGGTDIGLYVYGIKADFMITRTLIIDGKDQLWSRVK